MAKQSKTVKTTVNFKATAVKTPKMPSKSSADESANFSFGWEGTAFDELIYEARVIVDNVWPNTETPDIVEGLWDNTPIMDAVLAAIRRGIELGQGDDVADA